MVNPDYIMHNRYSGKVTSLRRYSWLIPVAIVAAFLLSLISSPVFADPGLKVTNAAIVVTVSPGQTLTQKMTVSIAAADPAIDISVKITGVAQSVDGGFELLDAAHDPSPYSARQFVSVDRSAFHLEPGGSQDVTATIQVPQDVGAGGRYAIINIETKPATGAGVRLISAVDVPVYLTIKGSQLIHTGKITELSVGNVTSGKPLDITSIFQNTGNHHYKVKGEVSVVNSQGQVMGNVTVPLTTSSIVPGMARQLKATFIPSGELAAGTYTVYSKVMLEDGTILDQANTTFEVQKAYVPPPAVGNITLAPASASTLKTDDDRISISFPQGAAVMPVDVSLRYYPAEQLPAPPPDVMLGTTCFRVDGLTGLLAKEATVTVKYSADDLSKAGGDASRLRLARWDEGNSQWTLLKTKVEAGSMTLSASSNQMSIWAVVIGAPASPGASWVTPVAVAAGVIVLALLVLLLARARKRQRRQAK